VSAWAVSGSNVFITDSTSGKTAKVDKAGALRTFALPYNSFSIPPEQATIPLHGGDIKPDPSGTRYAISSFTVNNPTASIATFRLFSVDSNFAFSNCKNVVNGIDSAPGPEMTIPPNSTTQLTFPTPFIISSVTGQRVCLTGGGNGFLNMKWSAVG